ncbi:MAG: hypothetical protein HZC14_01215 [Candidatus Niyogibacteria bacterium]|nr:hypothetical protein [Candidatus Niyogibacteria bacterium]
MNKEVLQKIQTLLAKKEIGIFAGTEPKEAGYLAKEALKTGLVMAGKNITDDGDANGLFVKWEEALARKTPPTQAAPQVLKIKIPKKNKIAEVSYDENDRFLNFLITPASGQINTNEIIIENAPPKIESAFCFFSDENNLDRLKERYDLPAEEFIATISPQGRLMAEKVAEIIKTLDEKIFQNKTVATLLFACLVLETNNFLERASKDALSLASQLMEYGADRDQIKKIQFTETPDRQLLGRALARTHVDKNTGTSWTFLTEQDFEKTRTPPSQNLFIALFNSFLKISPEQNCHLFLWKEKGGAVKGLLFSEQEKILSALSAKLDKISKDNMLPLPDYGNFTEAERKLRQLLQATL